MTFQNKKILVAGLGGTGISMIAYLRKNGAEVAAYDEELKAERVSQIGKMFDGLVFYTGRLKDALDNGFDILALSPGISERQPDIEAFKQNGGRVLGDIELLADIVNRRSDKVIAITGSNGKTTVTSLVGYLCIKCGLDTVIAGNIGTPVLEAELQREGKKADVWVLELSSFQLENTESLRPTAATVLNISEDHLDRYDDLLDYAHTKAKIFRGDGVQVLNSDDVFCRAMKRAGREVKWFSLEHEADFWLERETGQLKQGDEDLIATQDIPLQGLHNAANVMAAVACARPSVCRAKYCSNTLKPSRLAAPRRKNRREKRRGVYRRQQRHERRRDRRRDCRFAKSALRDFGRHGQRAGLHAPARRACRQGKRCVLDWCRCAANPPRFGRLRFEYDRLRHFGRSGSDGIRPSRSGRYCVAQPCLCEL